MRLSLRSTCLPLICQLGFSSFSRALFPAFRGLSRLARGRITDSFWGVCEARLLNPGPKEICELNRHQPVLDGARLWPTCRKSLLQTLSIQDSGITHLLPPSANYQGTSTPQKEDSSANDGFLQILCSSASSRRHCVKEPKEAVMSLVKKNSGYLPWLVTVEEIPGW